MKKLLLVLLLLPLFCFSQSARNSDEKNISNTTGGNAPQTKKNPCYGIERKLDEFTGEISMHFNDKGGELTFHKYIKDGIIDYYLSIRIKESSIYTGEGVYLILRNGKKISKPNEEVDYDYLGGDFYTDVFCELSKEDIEMLKESPIEKYKAYILTGSTEYYEETHAKFMCLLDLK